MKLLLEKIAQLADTLDQINKETADQVDQLLADLKADFDLTKEAELLKNAFIRKRNGKWCVISKKGKNLGCYTSRKAALKRLRQIEFFKHNK